MNYRFLIQGGRIVDGTGTAAYDADVRVASGRIVEVGKALTPCDDERIIDAAGCLVTPGFIETHNHWDGSVWWSPVMEPLSANGVTTSINGNCGFSMAPAPADPADRETIIEKFNFFEDIPEPPMKRQVPWNWRFWSEYKASMQRRVKLPVNYASFCGHIPIRLCVMGQDAWTRTRNTRAAAPTRLTLCNGIPTFDHEAFTGRFPGRFLGPELPQSMAA
jgi:N-acyl-D-amino-acid deacylase